MTDTQQVGYATVANMPRASVWNGTSGSWVDLTPAGSYKSFAYAASNGRQWGTAWLENTGHHAGYWSGTAASWVDINPVTVTNSEVWGASETQQVGVASVAPGFHACLWAGSSTSWVDLNPEGAINSWARGTSGEQQVGYVWLSSSKVHASLWRGSASTWVDLNPPGSEYSAAFGVSGGYQVGFAVVDGVYRASVWSGTAESWQDLSVTLPAGWGQTYAERIWSDGTNLCVAGYDFNFATHDNEALLWKRPLAPACYANCDGSTASPVLNANDFQCFLNAFATGSSTANCDGSTATPILNANDFQCFLNKFAAGCP